MNVVPFHPYYAKLARALDRMGGLYTPQDILKAISEDRMQSFTEGDSWAICQVAQYPRAKVLEILIAVGSINECRILHDRILKYAEENDISVIQAYGRRGWLPDAQRHGWKVKARNFVYQKEL